MTRSAPALLGALLSLLLAAPAAAQDFDFGVPQAPAEPLGRIVDADSVIAIQAPDDWMEYDLGVPDASITIGSPSEDAYFLVIVENKVDMYGWNLDRHSYITLAQSLVSMDFPEIVEDQDVEVDGRPSRSFVIQGATQGMQLSYIKVTVDAPTAFVQLIGWSTRSTFDQYGPVIRGIIDSAESLK